MRLIFHAICAWYVRVGALCLVAAAGATGMTRIEVFQATVPVADRSDAAQTAAFQAALRVALVRATGRRTADEEAVFAPLIGSARRYVQQYRSAPDNQLWVAFDGTAIERWLTQNGQPLWGRDRPSTLVWLTVQSGGQSSAALSVDDTSELKTAVDAVAELRGIPLVWPSADSVAAGPAAVNPVDLARRLGAEGVLIGRASAPVAIAAVHWTLMFQERTQEFTGLAEGIGHTADLYASLYAASGSVAQMEIDVSGVGDLQDYAAAQSYLESLNFITHVGVEALTGDTIRFLLTMRGGIEPLQRAVALNGRLQSLPAGENGIHRFQLRR
jgi:hypothetical protein